MKLKIYCLISVLFLYTGCNLFVNKEAPVVKTEEGTRLEARFVLPDWDAPKDGTVLTGGDTRIVDPSTTSADLYLFDGVSEVLLSTITINITNGNGEGDPDRFASGVFTGLEARTYEVGELRLYLSDGVDYITSGENIAPVTLTPQSSASVYFRSIPEAPTVYTVGTTITGTMPDGITEYYAVSAVGGKLYKAEFTRTGTTGDLDIYVFDENGFIINEDYHVEAQNELVIVYFEVDTSQEVYIALRAVAGSGNADLSFNVTDVTLAGYTTIYGTLTFPPASAGEVVHFDVSQGGTTLVTATKKVGRTGDTFMHFLIPGVAENLSSVRLDVVLDRNNNVDVNDIYADGGDYSKSVFNLNTSFPLEDQDLILEPYWYLGYQTQVPNISGTYNRVRYLADSTGKPYYTSTVSSYTYTGIISVNHYYAGLSPGDYRMGRIIDMDGSGAGLSTVSTLDQINQVLTDGDYFFLSDVVTYTDTTSQVYNYSFTVARGISGTVTLPEVVSNKKYVVFADTDTDFNNGIRYGYYGTTGFTDTLSYTFAVPNGQSFYIGAFVDMDGNGKLNHGDFIGYYNGVGVDPPGSATTVSVQLTGVDFLLGDKFIQMTGSITLPPGVNADGALYVMGFEGMDIWSNPVAVPLGTGAGGTFTYTFEGMPLGNNLTSYVLIDMDNNGFDFSPNYSDVVGMRDGLNLVNLQGETVDFTTTMEWGSNVEGTVNLPDYYYGKDIWILTEDHQSQAEGVVGGNSFNFVLEDVVDGAQKVFAVVDMDEDGSFGNKGDLFGEVNINVTGGDLTGIFVDVGPWNNKVSGWIQLPVDLPVNANYVVILENAQDSNIVFTDEDYISADADSDPDGLDYTFHNIPDGVYYLSVHIDLNNDGIISSGDYHSFYPFGGDMFEAEAIIIDDDKIDLNYNVDPSSVVP